MMNNPERRFWDDKCECGFSRASHAFDYSTDLGPGYGECVMPGCEKFMSADEAEDAEELIDREDTEPREVSHADDRRSNPKLL